MDRTDKFLTTLYYVLSTMALITAIIMCCTGEKTSALNLIPWILSSIILLNTLMDCKKKYHALKEEYKKLLKERVNEDE